MIAWYNILHSNIDQRPTSDSCIYYIRCLQLGSSVHWKQRIHKLNLDEFAWFQCMGVWVKFENQSQSILVSNYRLCLRESHFSWRLNQVLGWHVTVWSTGTTTIFDGYLPSEKSRNKNQAIVNLHVLWEWNPNLQSMNPPGTISRFTLICRYFSKFPIIPPGYNKVNKDPDSAMVGTRLPHSRTILGVSMAAVKQPPKLSWKGW